MPVSLLTVGCFVDFPVSRGAKHSYDRTNALPSDRTHTSPRKGPAVPESVAETVTESTAKRLVVLVSGSGTNLQALLDAIAEAGPAAYGAEVVAVGADRTGIEGLDRAERAGLPTFVCRVKDYESRDAWDAALTEAVAAHEPDLVVSAGFMKIVGKEFLARFGGRFVNTHPALLPSFPGAHGVRDALAYGAKVTGCTVHFVDDGVDTGPIIAQGVVEVRDEDDESALHERIKEVERRLLVEVVGRIARNGYRIEGRKVVIQ
ncbi:phosphoribosylglycinamide formyltransferase [Streptomyces sp. NPDC001848]|uniref:phosphoribosylglycinamide formyltransferase n=1 Tax=Streptomyces sp. NPDC001848 TaxID=3364618 RepID=UPI0036C7981E